VPSTRLYLVRHGATQLTAEDRFAGAVGVDLSDEGRWQAGRLAERLAPENIRAVYCSPLGRTVETAEILARPHRLDVKRRDAERGALVEALDKTGGNRTVAARLLGISRRTLYNKLAEHGIS